MNLCVCGHNSSSHSLSWNPFRGCWDTSCTARVVGVVVERCGCPAFRDEAEAAS